LATGAVQNGYEQNARTEYHIKVSDMSEQEWALFIDTSEAVNRCFSFKENHKFKSKTEA